MKLTDLELLVKTLNNKLAAENSVYRLKMNNNMDVLLTDIHDNQIRGDDEPIALDDLVEYVDQLISDEKSNM